MSKSQALKSFLFLVLSISLTLVSCYGSRGTASNVNLPGDPHLVVETFTPTPDPLIAGTLKIHREGIIIGGDGGEIEVIGELPLQLHYRESAFAGDDLIITQGDTKGVLKIFGHGTIGTGEINSTWDVTIKVRGILHPAPKCDVELWINEYWGDEVIMTMTINGQVVATTMAITDLIPMVSKDQSAGHIIIPKSQTELVEYVSAVGVDWINTYTIELQPLTKFEGCND